MICVYPADCKIYDDMDALLGYRLEILAETVFLSENKRNTTLTAHVWHGNTEVTDSIAAERFKWARESEDATADAVWNSAHQGFKSILVTTADLSELDSLIAYITEYQNSPNAVMPTPPGVTLGQDDYASFEVLAKQNFYVN